jgi:hypothetical protein
LSKAVRLLRNAGGSRRRERDSRITAVDGYTGHDEALKAVGLKE